MVSFLILKRFLHSVIRAWIAMSSSRSNLESSLVRILQCDSDTSPAIKIKHLNWSSLREFSLNFFTYPIYDTSESPLPFFKLKTIKPGIKQWFLLAVLQLLKMWNLLAALVGCSLYNVCSWEPSFRISGWIYQCLFFCENLFWKMSVHLLYKETNFSRFLSHKWNSVILFAMLSSKFEFSFFSFS